jgi:hypothetical protein
MRSTLPGATYLNLDMAFGVFAGHSVDEMLVR